MLRRLLPLTFWGILIPLLVSCARSPQSRSTLDELPTLPPARRVDQSTVLEVGFVDIPNDPKWTADVWSELDEQHLVPDVRQKISANGFRTGVVGMQLPAKLREELDRRQNIGMRGVLAEMSVGDKLSQGIRQIQLRPDDKSDVVTRSQVESLVVLVDDGENVVGKTFRDAQTVFSLRAFPLGDGRARIEMVPEVRYGPTKQRWTSGEGVFRMEAGQDRQTFTNLKIEAVLTPGQTLVLAASGPSRSLGGNFFAKNVDGGREKTLLIRLAQSQYDDIFGAADVLPQAEMQLTTELD